MSNGTNPTCSECRAKTELRGLCNCLMPHEDDLLRKSTTLVLVVGWLVWSIGLGMGTLTKGDTVLWGFTVYELFSFVVIYAFARLHDLEVKRLLGIAPDASEKLENRSRRDRKERRERRRDGSDSDSDSGGFRYGDSGRDDK